MTTRQSNASVSENTANSETAKRASILTQHSLAYRERIRAAQEGAAARADDIRSKMLQELGDDASPFELALIDSMVASMRAIGALEAAIQFSAVAGRGDRKSVLAKSLVASQGALLRSIRQIEVMRKQRKTKPKNISELIAAHRRESGPPTT